MINRNWLIEKIKEGRRIANWHRYNEEETIADHLIANGITVLPIKVGDKVYKISRNKVKECEIVFIGLSADEKCSYFNFVENYADGTFYRSYSMVFDLIGESVFLTKEDAERALIETKKKVES